jgi:hypothetical protein
MNNIKKVTNEYTYLKTGEESALIMMDYETNWIQFLHRHGYKIYYKTELVPDLIMQLGNNVEIIKAFQREDVRLLGLFKELCLERSKGKFTMPLFANKNSSGKWYLSCGLSRALANEICQTPINEYSVVYISRDTDLDETFIEIVDLKQFEEMFDISWLDYSIGMSRINDTDYRIISSVIRYSVYDFTEISDKFGFTGERCYDFWKQFLDKKQQIPITITCTKAAQDLIIIDPIFDVTWDEQERCQFSFKWMLEKYQNEGDSKLYCMINSITEPFKLHHLVPFMHRDYTGYHTEDKKLALISPHSRSSFQIIPNIVK